jgi:hypothetical protein
VVVFVGVGVNAIVPTVADGVGVIVFVGVVVGVIVGVVVFVGVGVGVGTVEHEPQAA